MKVDRKQGRQKATLTQLSLGKGQCQWVDGKIRK